MAKVDSVEEAIDRIVDTREELPEAYSDDILRSLVTSVENRGLTREDKLVIWTAIRNYSDAAVRNYVKV